MYLQILVMVSFEFCTPLAVIDATDQSVVFACPATAMVAYLCFAAQ